MEERVYQSETLSRNNQIELQNINTDLSKANEIIVKQNNIILELKEKVNMVLFNDLIDRFHSNFLIVFQVKLRTAIVLEQEKVIEKNSKEISKLTEQEYKLSDQVNHNNTAVEELKKQIESYKLVVEEKSNTIKKNNSGIYIFR